MVVMRSAAKHPSPEPTDSSGCGPLNDMNRTLARLRHGVAARSSRGQAVVELALILTFLGGLFVLTFDYGRAMNTYLLVVHAAREGARIAALEAKPTSEIETAAKNAATCRQAPRVFTASGTCDFFAAGDLTVDCTTITLNLANGTYTPGSACLPSRGINTAFRVTVSTHFTPLVPVVGFGSGGRYAGTIPISYSVIGLVLDEILTKRAAAARRWSSSR